MELRNRGGLDYPDSKENFLVLTLLERRIWKQIHEVLQRESKTCQRGVAAFFDNTRISREIPSCGWRKTLSNCQNIEFLF